MSTPGGRTLSAREKRLALLRNTAGPNTLRSSNASNRVSGAASFRPAKLSNTTSTSSMASISEIKAACTVVKKVPPPVPPRSESGHQRTSSISSISSVVMPASSSSASRKPSAVWDLIEAELAPTDLQKENLPPSAPIAAAASGPPTATTIITEEAAGAAAAPPKPPRRRSSRPKIQVELDGVMQTAQTPPTPALAATSKAPMAIDSDGPPKPPRRAVKRPSAATEEADEEEERVDRILRSAASCRVTTARSSNTSKPVIEAAEEAVTPATTATEPAATPTRTVRRTAPPPPDFGSTDGPVAPSRRKRHRLSSRAEDEDKAVPSTPSRSGPVPTTPSSVASSVTAMTPRNLAPPHTPAMRHTPAPPRWSRVGAKASSFTSIASDASDTSNASAMSESDMIIERIKLPNQDLQEQRATQEQLLQGAKAIVAQYQSQNDSQVLTKAQYEVRVAETKLMAIARSLQRMSHKAATQITEVSKSLKPHTRTLRLSALKVPINWWATTGMKEKCTFEFFATFTIGVQVAATTVKSIDLAIDGTAVKFEECIEFEEVEPTFEMEVKLFAKRNIKKETGFVASMSTPRKKAKELCQRITSATPGRKLLHRLSKHRDIDGSSSSSSNNTITSSSASEHGASAVAAAAAASEASSYQPSTSSSSSMLPGFLEIATAKTTLATISRTLQLVPGSNAVENFPIGHKFSFTTSFATEEGAKVRKQGGLNLFTQADNGAPLWDRHWMLLDGDQLSLWKNGKSEKDVKKRGSADVVVDLRTLVDCTVRKAKTIECGRKHTFDIRRKDADADCRPELRMAAGNEADRDVWMKILSHALVDAAAW